jgi:hypothetical protein
MDDISRVFLLTFFHPLMNRTFELPGVRILNSLVENGILMENAVRQLVDMLL